MRLSVTKLFARISDLQDDSGFIRLYTEHAQAVKKTEQNLMESVRQQMGGVPTF
jgi:hypothetical protein